MRRTTCVALAAAAVIAASAQPAGAQLFFDCQISGGGRLMAANGDQATFGGSVSTDRVPTGNQVYIDHGPATPLRFHTLTVTAVICDPDGRRGEILGTGEVWTELGTELVQYRIAVFAPSNRGDASDFYRITLSNGYDSGEQPVVHGNIVMQSP